MQKAFIISRRHFMNVKPLFDKVVVEAVTVEE